MRSFLIGETLMRQENVEAATRELLRSPWTPEAASPQTRRVAAPGRSFGRVMALRGDGPSGGAVGRT